MAYFENTPAMRREAHFGDRLVRCFAERPGSLHELFAAAVAADPAHEALVCGEQRLTYGQLDAEVGRIAAGLAQAGIAKGDRVGLLLGNRIEFVVAIFACARLGAVFVPINVRDQMPGIRHALGHSGAKALLFEAAVADRLPPQDALPDLAHRFDVDGRAYQALRDNGTITQAVPVDEEDVAGIAFTSGTTGVPKGAMLTHLGLVHSALHLELITGVTAADRSIMAVPLSHITGLVALTIAMVRGGATLIITPAFKAADFLALAAREKMTHSVLVPAMVNLCLLSPEFDAHDLSHWRLCGYGGAPMPTATIERLAARLPQLKLLNVYGATETTSPATALLPHDAGARGDSVGRALPCADLLVVDDAGREVPPGEAGEIWIGGPMAVAGYWNNEVATAKEFTAGFWHSGDIGRIDAQGYVHVFDRKKDMINRGGYKVYTVEVENALMQHPAVAEVAVVSSPCPVLGERVNAFVVFKGEGVAEAELKAHCAALLSDYKVPERFIAREGGLPRNANGKLQKLQLREALLAG
jgi:acyl-CoA synthetase (AMP-forming)/AMP-acid ligase II